MKEHNSMTSSPLGEPLAKQGIRHAVYAMLDKLADQFPDAVEHWMNNENVEMDGSTLRLR